MTWRRRLAVPCLATLLSAAVQAAATVDETLLDLSLEELINIPVDTAGNFSSSWRSQPGIITIFNSTDIQAMGARTLRDVLLHIPGVSLGMDNHNAVNLLLRGNWAHEGKIEYLVNDIPVNDVIFGTFPLPPYLPADQLDRVEILRGPGSVKYGDSAQLAVIRIYTHNQASSAHVAVTGMDQSGARTGMVSFNKRLDFASGSLAVAGSFNSGRWGAGTWIDDMGTPVDVARIGTTGSSLAASADWLGTKVDLFYSDYSMDGVQYFGTYNPGRVVSFNQLNMAVSRDFALAGNWTVRPRLSYHSESSWKSSDATYAYNIPGERLDARLDATNRYAGDASVVFGLYHQLLRDRALGPQQGVAADIWLAPDAKSRYSESAIYGNWDLTLGGYNLSLGARVSDHQYSGTTVTPQFAMTRTTPAWHCKALRGTASRDPNLEQINPTNHPNQPTLKSEYTTVNELECGHVLSERSYLTGSIFAQTIDRAIVYLPNPGGFANNAPSRTRGIDLQYWYRGDRVTIQGNYDLARANDYALPLYQSLDQRGQNLGAAKQIANLWLDWRTAVPNLSVQFDARYLGSRAAFAYSQALGTYGQQVLPAEKTLHVAARYKLTPLTLSFGVRNVGNAKQLIPQPYDASVLGTPGSTPFPVDGRELWVRAEWPLLR